MLSAGFVSDDCEACLWQTISVLMTRLLPEGRNDGREGTLRQQDVTQYATRNTFSKITNYQLPFTNYSYLSASTGSKLAARLAG